MKINEEYNGCECSKALKQIEDAVSDLNVHKYVDIVTAIDVLAAELRMRRAKEIYEIKLKASIVRYANEHFKNFEE